MQKTSAGFPAPFQDPRTRTEGVHPPPGHGEKLQRLRLRKAAAKDKARASHPHSSASDRDSDRPLLPLLGRARKPTWQTGIPCSLWH